MVRINPMINSELAIGLEAQSCSMTVLMYTGRWYIFTKDYLMTGFASRVPTPLTRLVIIMTVPPLVICLTRIPSHGCRHAATVLQKMYWSSLVCHAILYSFVLRLNVHFNITIGPETSKTLFLRALGARSLEQSLYSISILHIRTFIYPLSS
jgi:hypothetical protein